VDEILGRRTPNRHFPVGATGHPASSKVTASPNHTENLP
jgi:hypothetical protein